MCMYVKKKDCLADTAFSLRVPNEESLLKQQKEKI